MVWPLLAGLLGGGAAAGGAAAGGAAAGGGLLGGLMNSMGAGSEGVMGLLGSNAPASGIQGLMGGAGGPQMPTLPEAQDDVDYDQLYKQAAAKQGMQEAMTFNQANGKDFMSQHRDAWNLQQPQHTNLNGLMSLIPQAEPSQPTGSVYQNPYLTSLMEAFNGP